MSKIPDPIDLKFETNEGYTFKRRDEAILEELVEKFNQLVTYLDSISERL